MANLVIQKYGGTSVGTPAKIKDVAARIARVRRQGDQLAVVVSAMGHTTDELMDLARQVSPAPAERELDMLLSAGERISMALLSMALRDQGLEAISFTGSQAGIITDDSHTRARILEIKPARVREELDRGRVVIVAGFQGVSRGREITTLGRGGSDTTAVALAAALGANRCEILTDVSGIFSADPRRVRGARRYGKLPLDLVFEMAVQGAQVMHARSLEIARQRGMTLWVGHATHEQEGTMIIPQQNATTLEAMVSELPRVTTIATRAGLTKITVEASEAPPFLAALTRDRVIVRDLQFRADAALEVLVDPTECQAFLNKGVPALTKAPLQDTGLATLSLIGYQLQQETSVIAEVLAVLEAQKLKPLRLTALSHSIKVWLAVSDSAQLDLAVQALHDRLST